MLSRKKYPAGLTALWIIPAAAALLVLAGVAAGLLSPVSPDAVTLEYFDQPFLDRAAAYERIGLTVYLLRQALSLTFLTVVALWSMRYFLLRLPVSLPAAAGYIILFLLLYQLLNLPLDYYRGFLVEHRFGFSAHTPLTWFLDYGKSFLINLVITTAGLAGFYFLLRRLPGYWWAAAGALFTLFILLSSYLYPLLIHPLFYSFTPLEDAVLNEEILDMAERTGIEVGSVLVADAGRFTWKVNAYFTGLGNTKRIIIFDNLLHHFDRAEVMVVIAHEMGHWRHRHIGKGIALASLGVFLGLFLFKLILQGAGLSADFRAVPLAVLLMALVSLAVMPIENAVSRHFEREADRTSLSLTTDPGTFISLKQNLSRANLSTVRPHRLVRWALYSHPPIMERIEMAIEKREAEFRQ